MASAMEKLCSDANVTVEDPEDLKSPFVVHLFREDSTDDASRSGDDGHLPDMTALVSVVNGLLCNCVQTSMDWGSPCAVGVVLPFRDRGLQQKYIVFLDGQSLFFVGTGKGELPKVTLLPPPNTVVGLANPYFLIFTDIKIIWVKRAVGVFNDIPFNDRSDSGR